MKRAPDRTGTLLLFATLLQACGGDSSDSPSGLTLSTDEVSVTGTPGDALPTAMVTVTIEGTSDAVVRWDATISRNGVDTVDYGFRNESTADLTIDFRPPSSLQNGTYTDTIQVRACLDDPCTAQAKGSPKKITTTYTVTGEGNVNGGPDRDHIEITAEGREQQSRVETIRMSFDGNPPSGIYVQTTTTHNAIDFTHITDVAQQGADLEIAFVPASQLGPGPFNDTVTVTACYDPSCVRQINGSPFEIATVYQIGVQPEPGTEPLPVTSLSALPHNVIDAEFSKALNQVVMVGSYPANALYVYDIATATEQQQLLNEVPTTVSVSPDGLTAAVGHDALISVVSLASVGQPGAPAPTLLDVSTEVYDVVLAGTGYVHAFPASSDSHDIYSIEIASNTEHVIAGLREGHARARLDPSGNFVYASHGAFIPEDIVKWNMADGVAELLYDSPYSGEYPMCEDLWFNETGTSIYTTCGNIFSASPDQAQDMNFSGEIGLLDGVAGRWFIGSLSYDVLDQMIALLELDGLNCGPLPQNSPCYTHLVAAYESSPQFPVARYTLSPMSVDGVDYSQRGLFVFYDSSGSHLYMISKLEGEPNPDAEFYFSVVF